MRPPIQTGSMYHIYNRGVEKRNVFADNSDRARFIHYLYQLNNANSSPSFRHLNAKLKLSKSSEVGPPNLSSKRKEEREPIVDILAFVLMPNHYHLMVKQRVDGGVSQFMQKLGTGYTMFFNEKYKRSGALFQGKYKYVPVESHSQLLYLPHYIHLNPLKMFGGPTSELELENYRWSSYLDYIGKKNFQSVIAPKEVLDVFGGSEKYKTDLEDLARTKFKGLAEIETIALDWGQK